jgi:hypothetical protein
MRTKANDGSDWKKELVDLVMLHGLSSVKRAIQVFSAKADRLTLAETADFSVLWPKIRLHLPPSATALLALLEASGLTPIGGPNLNEFDRRMCFRLLCDEILLARRGRASKALVIYGPFAELIQHQISQHLHIDVLQAGQAAAASIARVLLEHMAASGPIHAPLDFDHWPSDASMTFPEYPSLPLKAIEICCYAGSLLPGRGRRRVAPTFDLLHYPDIVMKLVDRDSHSSRTIKAADWSGAKRLLLLGAPRRQGAKRGQEKEEEEEEDRWLMDATKAEGQHLQIATVASAQTGSDIAPRLHLVAELFNRSEVSHSLSALPGLLARSVQLPRETSAEHRMRGLISARAAYLLDPYSPASAASLLDLLGSWPGPVGEKLYGAIVRETIEQFNRGHMVLTRRQSAGRLVFNHWLPYLSRNTSATLRIPEELEADDVADFAVGYLQQSGEKTVLAAIEKGFRARFSDKRHVEAFKQYVGAFEHPTDEARNRLNRAMRKLRTEG